MLRQENASWTSVLSLLGVVPACCASSCGGVTGAKKKNKPAEKSRRLCESQRAPERTAGGSSFPHPSIPKVPRMLCGLIPSVQKHLGIQIILEKKFYKN